MIFLKKSIECNKKLIFIHTITNVYSLHLYLKKTIYNTLKNGIESTKNYKIFFLILDNIKFITN